MSFTVFRSSAGSGKTYTLVMEYLKLVIPEPWKFRNILAITFTNKAANEMKERVLGNLRKLSSGSDQKLMEAFMRETGMEKEAVSSHAARALELILHHYSDFAIGTIDAFSHRIVRSFARDFGLPVNFLVTLESGILRETAVDMLLGKAGEEPEMTKFLVRFLESMIDENNGWNIEKILLEFSKVLDDEETTVYLEKLKGLDFSDLLKISRHVEDLCRIISAEISRPAKDAISLIDENGISPSSFFGKDKGFYTFMKRIADGDFSKVNPTKYISEPVDNGKWFTGAADTPDKRKISEISDDLLRIYQEFARIRDSRLPLYNTVNLIRKTFYPMGVLNMLEILFSGYKRQNNLVHVGEFNRRISSMISGEPVPFVYERLGERFSHILIDEFQDTSRLQWENLLPLIDNSLGTGSFNLVVGDGKQAIYRWRNGEVEQFINLPKVKGSTGNNALSGFEKSLEGNFFLKNLDCNYRSADEIVNFNNSFFSFLKDNLKPDNVPVYDGVVQKSSGVPGGLVSVEFLPKNDFISFNCNRILEIINDLHDKGYSFSDIAILCRSNDKASETARFLMLNGIDVVSAESLLLDYSKDVRLLINCIRLLNDPEENFIRAEIILTIHEKGFLKTPVHESLQKLTGSSAGFRHILHEAGISLDLKSLSSLPLYDLCEELSRIFRFDEQPNAYVQFFLDAVLEYSKDNPDDTGKFIDWWELKKKDLSVVVPEGMNAVRVMTIHKAKGLQFPVVILPYANQPVRSGKRFLWVELPADDFKGLPVAMVKPGKTMLDTPYASLYDEEMRKSELDFVNILYVGFTRPEKALYILSQWPGKTSNGTSVQSLLKAYLGYGGKWNEDTASYIFGDLPESANKNNQEETLVRMDSFISSDYRTKINIRPNAPDSWEVDDPLKQRAKGELVHLLLSGIITDTDIHKAIAKAVDEGVISISEQNSYLNVLKEITGHEKLKEYFSGDILALNETEIIGKDGKSYRPDRIVISGKNAILIDYKTGRNDEHYKKQLEKYEQLLNELGYNVSKKILVFVNPVTVTEV